MEGIGINLTGRVVANASFSVVLDGVIFDINNDQRMSNNTLVSISNMEDKHHTLSLTSTITDSASDMIIFDKVVLTSQVYR